MNRSLMCTVARAAFSSTILAANLSYSPMAQASDESDTEPHASHGDHAHEKGESARSKEEKGQEATKNVAEHSHHHRFALGLSAGPVYLVSEKELVAGIHGHFIVALGESGIGLGVGYEHLFDDHNHNAIALAIQYRLLDPWTISISPGVAFQGVDFSTVEPALHVETAYEFEVSIIDIGPAFEVAIEPDEVHLTLALHLGIHF